MHVIEHIGLGRYGEPFDVNGDLKAFEELKRIVKPNGDLLLVVPLGKKSKIHNDEILSSKELDKFKYDNTIHRKRDNK
jgi:ubiquinone/menaquinone biosynthesis C-methylase UbiE